MCVKKRKKITQTGGSVRTVGEVINEAVIFYGVYDDNALRKPNKFFSEHLLVHKMPLLSPSSVEQEMLDLTVWSNLTIRYSSLHAESL